MVGMEESKVIECFEDQENIQPCESCMAWQWCRYEFIAKDLTTAQINSRTIGQSYFEKVRSWEFSSNQIRYHLSKPLRVFNYLSPVIS